MIIFIAAHIPLNLAKTLSGLCWGRAATLAAGCLCEPRGRGAAPGACGCTPFSLASLAGWPLRQPLLLWGPQADCVLPSACRSSTHSLQHRHQPGDVALAVLTSLSHITTHKASAVGQNASRFQLARPSSSCNALDRMFASEYHCPSSLRPRCHSSPPASSASSSA